MKEKYIIALDQGTSSSRSIIFNSKQEEIAIASKPIHPIFPQEGWIEHDPMEIYASQVSTLNEVIAKSNINASQIEAIGITNQRETTLIWDRVTGKPIHNAIVWQCRRTAEMAKSLIEQGHAPMIKSKTGLPVDAYFSATKIRWILDHVEGAQEKAENGHLMFGTVDTWLIYNLSNKQVHATDVTNASRTMLFNIHTLEWDEELLELFNIPKSVLPVVKNSSDFFGETNIQGHLIPITAAVGDQQAALFGQCAFEKGEAKNTYGTGCFLLMNTGTEVIDSKHGLLSTIAIGINGEIQYALEGSIFMAGAILQWMRDELGIINDVKETSKMALSIPDNGGVYLVPAFNGLGAPYWDNSAKGTIIGLSRNSNKNHIVRAGLEAIAFQAKDVLESMAKDTKHTIKSLKVDGGASDNDFLMQFQSDILNIPVERPKTVESTALGAAMLAGLYTGFFKSKAQIKENIEAVKTWNPEMENEKRIELEHKWTKALKRSQDWLES